MTEKIYKVSVEYGPSINALEGFGCFGAGDCASGEMWITQEAMDGLRVLDRVDWEELAEAYQEMCLEGET